MFHQKKLIHFYKESYQASISSIKTHAQILIDAAKEMEKLGLPKINPNNLRDGFFVQRVLDFYKQEWKNNPAFEKVYFEKYLDLISLDYSKVTELEIQYNASKNGVLKFYKTNHKFYAYWDGSPRKGNLSFVSKVSFSIEKLYNIEGGKITVNLDEEYYKLYSTSNKQLDRIEDINNFIKAAKELNVDFKLVKSGLGSLLRDIRYDLSSYEINYCELMHKY
tara:strand:+ start:4742 stop:5404 length:663 start_codon:yes stop_codon:yes gene_type:complete